MDIFGKKAAAQRHKETKAMFTAVHDQLAALENSIATLTAETRDLSANIEQAMPLCCTEKQRLLIDARESASRLLNTVARLHPVGR